MLNIEAPAQLILTLQSVPPFIVESIFALALTVLLAVPLISQIQLFFDETLKSCKSSRSDDGDKIRPNAPVVVMHYPTPVPFGIESSSSSILNASSLRSSYSTPAFSVQNEPRKPAFLGPGKVRPPEHSLSYIATNKDLSIVDISSFNYSSYRHKLIEAALRKRYGGNYPPGNVILNSIHLNTTDSSAESRLNDKYNTSFFDFDEHHRASNPRSKLEVEYLHPLDHFVVRPSEKPLTSDKNTETMNTTEDEILSDISRPQTPSTPLSRPVTRRRTNSVGRGCAVSNATSRSPLSRVSSRSPSVRPVNGASSRSLSSDSGRQISTNASHAATKPPITRQLYTRKKDPKIPGTGSPVEKKTRPRSPDPPGTPDSSAEPTTKKLKATRRLVAAKSVLEDPNPATKLPGESDTVMKNADEDAPARTTEVIVKPTPGSMIPRPTKSKADQERFPTPVTEVETDEVAIVENMDPSSRITSRRYRGPVPRRNSTPPPAWNNNSNATRSFNRKFNGLGEDADEMWSSKCTITPRPRVFERRNSSASRRCGSSPSSGKVSRSSSPIGRPKTANAVDPKMRRDSRLSTATTPRKSLLQDKRGSKMNAEKPLMERCRTSGSRTWTDKSSVTLSTSQDGSFRSRNVTSESSSGLLRSVQLPVLHLNLSSSSSVGVGKGEGRTDDSWTREKSGSTGSCSELAKKRRGPPDKVLIRSAVRSKIATAPNSRLSSARSKHSTEVLDACGVPGDKTATTQRPAVTRRDASVTEAATSRAKSEVRNGCREKSEDPDHKRLRGRSTGGELPLQTLSRAREIGRGKSCDKKSSSHTITRIGSRLKTADSVRANASRIGSDEIEVEHGLGGKVESGSRIGPRRGMGIETRVGRDSSESPAAGVTGSVFAGKVTRVDKVEFRNSGEDKRSVIKGKSMTSRAGLSENKRVGKVSKNREVDKKTARSLSSPIAEQIKPGKNPQAPFDDEEVDSEMLFFLNHPLHSEVRRERSQSIKMTRIPSPVSSRLTRTQTDPAALRALRHSASSKSAGRPAKPRESRYDTTKSDLSEVSKLLRSDSATITEKLQESVEKGNKAESTIQRSLRNYIKKLKVVLSNENSSTTAEEIASLNLTDAILPDMRSVLGSYELNRLVGILEHAERSTTETDRCEKTVP